MFKNNSNNTKKVDKRIYEALDIPETEATAEIIEKLDKDSEVITKELQKDMADFHNKMREKYGDNYRGTNITCSILIDNGGDILKIENPNFFEYNLKTKGESENIIQALKFYAESNGFIIQYQLLDEKNPSRKEDRKKIEKMMKTTQRVVEFTKDFLGERIYEELGKKGYLLNQNVLQSGLIDFNNKEALDELRKILDKRTPNERVVFWSYIDYGLKKIADM